MPLLPRRLHSLDGLHRLHRLHRQLAEIADPRDPRSWLLTSLAALGDALPTRPLPYLISDGEPHADTFLAWEAPPPECRAAAIVEGVLAALAARASLRAIDGELPEQPLATTLDRRGGCRSVASELRCAAFALDGQTWLAELPDGGGDDGDGGDGGGGAALRALVLALASPTDAARLCRLGDDERRRGGPLAAVPFVTVSLDEEPVQQLRHCHRRGWRDERGPWLGLGRAGALRAVTTSHFAVDGYGHAWITADLGRRAAALAARHAAPLRAALRAHRPLSGQHARLEGPPPGRAAPLPGMPAPLGLAWRPLAAPAPRVIPLAYRFAQLLAQRLTPRDGGRPLAMPDRSPTVGIPIAPGDKSDPLRLRRRVAAAVVAVRYTGGRAEPLEAFAARAAATLAAEASGAGMLSTLRRATANLPLPLRWKRQVIGGDRGRWMGELPAALGGRGCLSVIRLRQWSSPALVAVSSPPSLASSADPAGSCVVTIVDDGERAMITASGSGLAGDASSAAALLDELADG